MISSESDSIPFSLNQQISNFEMDPDYQAVHDFLIARRLVLPFEETVPKWTNLIIENMIPVEIEEDPDEEIDWSAYDWQELMKWTVSKDQIKLLRRLGPKQFVFPPEEIIPRELMLQGTQWKLIK